MAICTQHGQILEGGSNRGGCTRQGILVMDFKGSVSEGGGVISRGIEATNLAMQRSVSMAKRF